jgi:hypothetical protein
VLVCAVLVFMCAVLMLVCAVLSHNALCTVIISVVLLWRSVAGCACVCVCMCTHALTVQFICYV